MAKSSKDIGQRGREDALKYALTCEADGGLMTEEGLAGKFGQGRAQCLEWLQELSKMGWISLESEGWRLSETGRIEANKVLRAHRIYETYLAERTSTPGADWHNRAEDKEHELSEQEVNRMAKELGYPRFDPHGDPIPTRQGELETREGEGLLSLAEGESGLILHVEDEPPVIFENLTREGFAPGMEITLLSKGKHSLKVRLEGRSTEIDLKEATKVEVRRLDLNEVHQNRMRLSQLDQGQIGKIVKLSPACRGSVRRRLLDMGLVPGTEITHELRGAFAFPRAFRIRGTLIALRQEQADKIIVEVGKEVSHV